MAVTFTLKPVLANAQSSEPLDPSTARIHIGPLFLSPSLFLREFGIDTNVFNSTDDPKSDFTMTLVPQVQATMTLGRRLLLTGTGGTDLIYYATYANERSVNGNYNVRADLSVLRRVTLFASDSLVNTRERPSYEFDIRPRHTDHATRAGVIFKLHDKVSLEASAGESQTRYESTAVVDGTSLATSLDGKSQSVAALGSLRLTPYTTITLHGDVTHDRFTYDQTRNSNSFSIEPGVTFNPRALISGTAAVGYQHFETTAPGIPKFSGLVASAGLSYRLNGATVLGTNVERGLSYSFEALGPYYIRNDVSLNLRRQLVGRFDTTVSALRSRYAYQSVIAPAIPVQPGDREDRTTSYSADLGYRANRKARIGFGVESWHRTSNQRSDKDYTGFRFRSTATVAF